MKLSHDILLDDNAFTEASNTMQSLSNRTETLRQRLEKLSADLLSALDTPAGEKINITEREVLIKPLYDMQLILDHIHQTLIEICDTGNYKDIFIKFEQLNESVKFNL